MLFSDFLKQNIVVFDGAFGTVLQKKIGNPGAIPELLIFERPEVIEEIHREYAAAGADVISANTFGANEGKISDPALSAKLTKQAVSLARKAAKEKFVALDIGPTGKILEPAGELTFEEAYGIFARQILAGKDGADLILIETMSDLQELRAALLAARENSDLPVLCSMTFTESGRTFMGCDPVSYALTASPLSDAVGVNCSLGPDKLLPVVQKILAHTAKPVLVQANAGLPDAQMRYNVSADDFAKAYEKFLALGVCIIGGCCGTSPEYIQKLRALADKAVPAAPHRVQKFGVCSSTKAITGWDIQPVGERINPTGKSDLEEAIREGNYDVVQSYALDQMDEGAALLDVNAGIAGIDEAAALSRMIREIQAVCNLPLLIDSTNPAAIEQSLRVYCGRAIVNSVTGEEAILRSILPIAKKYGAAVVGLTMDEHGIPDTAQKRLNIAKKILRTAKEYGFSEQDIIIDCLTTAACTDPEQLAVTLEATRLVKRELNVLTMLGISNASFGYPHRAEMSAAYLSAALLAGCDFPILNPSEKNMRVIEACRHLRGEN